MLPLEATAALGSLAGIAELAREALGGRPRRRRSRGSRGPGTAIGMTLTFWHWLALGGLLLLLEVFTPGFVFIWLGAGRRPDRHRSLAGAGDRLAGAGADLRRRGGGQRGGLLLLAAAVSASGRRPAAEQPGASYVGTEAELVGAIGPGHGRVRIADSTWPAAGPELPAGTRVRIIGARGAVLLVMPVAGDGRPVSESPRKLASAA